MRVFIVIAILSGLIASGFAQQTQQPSALQRRETSTRSIRGASLPLEERLKDLEKKRSDLERLVEYIPLEGAVDENEYIVGPGDQFTISIASGIEEQFQTMVGADGSIVLPFTTSVKVAGKTLADAKAAITSALSKVIQESGLTVSLTAARLFKVNIVGMVNLPGDQTVSAVHRVFSAIEMAGGKLPIGDLSRVKLIRENGERVLDLTKFLYEGDLTHNPYLLDGDVVVVRGVDFSQPMVFLFGAGYSGAAINIDNDSPIEEILQRVGADREMIDLADIGIVRGGELYSVDLFRSAGGAKVSDGDSLYFKTLPDSVYVGGRVVGGGPVPYVAGADYRAYIAMAGGITQEGGMAQVKIVRSGNRISPNKAGMIRRGDVIIVGTSPWFVLNEAFKSLGSIGTFASAIYVIGFRD